MSVPVAPKQIMEEEVDYKKLYEKEKAEREKEKAEREKERKQNARLVQTSMKATYTNEIPGGEVETRLPKIKINEDVTPSVKSTNRQGRDIPLVEIKSCDKNSWVEPEKITIAIEDQCSEALLESELGAKAFGKPEGLEYVNEIEIQVLVQAMVNDAIKSLGLEDVLKSHVEVALYSMIPDVIVLKLNQRVVFAIEVKSPEHKKSCKVFDSESVAGQIWLYLQSMRQHGVERPMGAVMTYNKISLVSLDDLGKSEHHTEIVKKACDSLQSPIRQLEKMPASPGKDESSPSRETELLRNVNARFEGIFNDETDEDGDYSLDRQVFYSKVFEDKLVFPALLQALKVAFLDCDPTKMKEILPVVCHEDDLGKRMFFKMSEQGYAFVVSHTGLKADAYAFPAKNSKAFYMLTQVGGGKAGYTHLACNTSGRLAAIKLYLPNRSTKALESERNKEEEVSLTRKKEECKEELDRWKTLLPRYPVFECILDRVPALVMPYGREIKLEDREAALREIETELRRYAEAGWKYAESDLRWRHVLRDFEGTLFLGDLESLEAFSEKKNSAAIEYAVSEQIKCLSNRIGDANLHSASDESAGASEPPGILDDDEQPKKKAKREACGQNGKEIV